MPETKPPRRDPIIHICTEVVIGSYEHKMWVSCSYRAEAGWCGAVNEDMEKALAGEVTPERMRLAAAILLSASEECEAMNAAGAKGWPWRERELKSKEAPHAGPPTR